MKPMCFMCLCGKYGHKRIMFGKPIIKETRITVEVIIRKFADGYSLKDILEN